MPDFASHPAFEIARRLELRGEESFAWLAILDGGENTERIKELAHEIRLVLDTETRIIEAYPVDFDHLREQLRSPSEDLVILLGLEKASEHDWAVLDVNRSALERPGAIVLWLSLESISRLNSQAPNLRSFIGGSIFMLSDQGDLMTEDERVQRLAQLEDQFKLTGDAVIQLAKEGKLPAEPDFAEWLVLLGRGDLL